VGSDVGVIDFVALATGIRFDCVTDARALTTEHANTELLKCPRGVRTNVAGDNNFRVVTCENRCSARTRTAGSRLVLDCLYFVRVHVDDHEPSAPTESGVERGIECFARTGYCYSHLIPLNRVR
jgi:hypothetical protein